MLNLALRYRFLMTAAILLVVAAGAPVAGRSTDLVCNASPDYDVLVDGILQPGARVFRPNARYQFLIDTPSEPSAYLVNVPDRQAVAISRWDIKPGKTNDVLRAAVPEQAGASSYEVFLEGPVLRFRTGNSEVRLVQADKGSGFAPPDEASKPITPSAEARACLRWESRPAPAGTPGCAKFVYLRNSCDVPVVAEVSRTEHLLSGPMPQTFQTVVPATGEQSLGCDWWSGATAPSEHELLSAGFLPDSAPHGHGKKDHPSRH
jgi:hypothetical protein